MACEESAESVAQAGGGWREPLFCGRKTHLVRNENAVSIGSVCRVVEKQIAQTYPFPSIAINCVTVTN